MTTSIGPVYFFDQPSRRRRKIKGRPTNLVLEGLSQQDWQTANKNQSDVLRMLPGETHEEDSPEITSSVFSLKEQDVMEGYRRTAPQLLSELAHVLSQHKWSAEGRVPHGLVNILHYTWQELTAGARLLPGPQHTEKHRQSLVSSNRDSPQLLSSNQERERDAAAPCQVKPQVSTNVQVKKRKSRSCKDLSSTSLSFSILNQSSGCQEWITQQQDISCVEDIHLYKWALERLQGAKCPGTVPSDLNRPLLMRHYGDLRRKSKKESERTKARPGLPQIPDMQPLALQSRQKLHYRINDGSSIIYYPSGCMAVCQSYSAQPYGGFYTNVFSDSEPPVIIATITASGHGTVMHPGSSSISAVWDQEGGLLYDLKGCITKEWSWSTGLKKRSIVIRVTEVISLDLCSGTSATLNFKCCNEHVHLPLSALSNTRTADKWPYLQTNSKFTSSTAQDLLGVNSPVFRVDSNSRTQTCVSVCSRDVPQMIREVERLHVGPSLWRREGRPIRELRKIQQRGQGTLNEWMDFYCEAIGIKCPDMQRMPDVPPRSRLKREVQSAALPSLNSPERTDAQPVPPQGDVRLQTHLSVPGQKNIDSALKLSRSPQKKRAPEDCPVTRIGPVQIHGDIKRKSVILPIDPDQQVACFTHPVELPLGPSVPVTHCPVLLRAALRGDSSQRRCHCSPWTMPAVTDLEYDLFVLGQPPHSHQMLIVCVTCQNLYPRDASRDAPEQLYRRRNKHRIAPCTQCQVDSFRLVSYEVSTPKPCFEAEKDLLQQRHNAAPGMVLMYIKGKLLFIGYIEHSGHCCLIKDIERQISKARGDYRSGLYLPPDFKFRDTIEPDVGKVTSSSSVPGDNPKKSGLSEETENFNVKVKGPEVTRPQSKKDHKRKKTQCTSRPTHSP